MKRSAQVDRAEVNRIRDRYYSALQKGMSKAEATAFANAPTAPRALQSIPGPTPAQKAKLAKAAGGPAAVEIPEGWQSLHHMRRASIAKKIDPRFKPDPNDRTGSIDAVIEAELKRRQA